MTVPRFSRRRLLSALPFSFLAWFFPRPRRAAAAPRRYALPPAWWPSKYDSVLFFTYDHSGNLIRKEERLVRRAEPVPWPVTPLVQVTSYSYDSGAL